MAFEFDESEFDEAYRGQIAEDLGNEICEYYDVEDLGQLTTQECEEVMAFSDSIGSKSVVAQVLMYNVRPTIEQIAKQKDQTDGVSEGQDELDAIVRLANGK